MTDNNRYSHAGITATERDRMSPVWDMSQERVYHATLLNQRFNFMMILFSLVIAGALNSKQQIHLQLILTVGTIVISLFRSVIGRTQEKLDLIIADIYTDETHPATIIERRSKKGGSRRHMIGTYIPWFVTGILIIAAILAWLNILTIS